MYDEDVTDSERTEAPAGWAAPCLRPDGTTVFLSYEDWKEEGRNLDFSLDFCRKLKAFQLHEDERLSDVAERLLGPVPSPTSAEAL